jgi:hypothetical protein
MEKMDEDIYQEGDDCPECNGGVLQWEPNPDEESGYSLKCDNCGYDVSSLI